MRFHSFISWTAVIFISCCPVSGLKAQRVINQFEYNIVDPPASPEEQARLTDRAYRVLEKSNPPPGKGDFYFQLRLEKIKFPDTNCGEGSDRRRLNTVTADVDRLTSAQSASPGDQVKSVPLLVFGGGIDPFSGNALDKPDQCRLRPIRTQYSKRVRYEGKENEGYDLRLNFLTVHERSDTLRKIVNSLLKIPVIVGNIPAGYNGVTQELGDTILAARQRKEGDSDYRDVHLTPMQSKKNIHRLQIIAEDDRGSVDIFLKKWGSLILDSNMTHEEIINADLWEERKGFLALFGESQGQRPERKEGEARREELPLIDKVRGLSVSELATQDGKKLLTTYCEKVQYAAVHQMRLSKLDAHLVRRSMALYSGHAEAISKDVVLQKACWSPENEKFIRSIVVPEFAKDEEFEKFANY